MDSVASPVCSTGEINREMPASDQSYAGAIAVACMVMRDLCGISWNPSEVLFPFRRSKDIGPYKMFFRAPLRFGADHSALAFPATWLDHPLGGADSNVQAAVETLLAGISTADTGKVAGQVNLEKAVGHRDHRELRGSSKASSETATHLAGERDGWRKATNLCARCVPCGNELRFFG